MKCIGSIYGFKRASGSKVNEKQKIFKSSSNSNIGLQSSLLLSPNLNQAVPKQTSLGKEIE
jgi:hypothetical protein